MKVVVLVVVASSLLVGGGHARADDVAGASKAYSRAQQAMLSGKYSQAADLFELADSLSPTAAALRSAVRARYAAGHMAAAATHAAELLRRYPADRRSRAFAEKILDELAPKLGRVLVRCSSPCTVSADGQAVATARRAEHSFFVRPGAEEVVATFADDKQAASKVETVAGAEVTVRLEEPPDPILPAQAADASEPGERSRGIHKGWAIGGAVITAGLTVGATVYGMSTLEARDDIREMVRGGDLDGAQAAYGDAEKTQRRTNGFIAGAAMVGVATLTLAVFTEWSSSEQALDVQPTRGGVALSFGGRF